MQDFLSMGGYGAYVWPSYGLTAIVLLALLIASVRGLKSTQSEFDRLKALTGRGGDAQNTQEQKTETPNGDET